MSHSVPIFLHLCDTQHPMPRAYVTISYSQKQPTANLLIRHGKIFFLRIYIKAKNSILEFGVLTKLRRVFDLSCFHMKQVEMIFGGCEFIQSNCIKGTAPVSCHIKIEVFYL